MNKDRCYGALSWVKYLLRNATCVAACNYGRRKNQVSKDHMYMMTALWMEQSPWNFKYPKNQSVIGDEKKLNVVGAVFVLPNDRVLSTDCSRKNDSKAAKEAEGDDGIVHGAVQALIKYPDRVKDCKVYLSRKPCAHCVKMLVQAAVEKVFYLPLRPEKYDEIEDKSVDALFQVSTVSRSFFVPNFTEKDIGELEESKKPYDVHDLGDQNISYAKEEWKKWKTGIKRQLSWEEYEGEIVKNVDEEMERMFDWFGRATYATGKKKDMVWKPLNDKKFKEQQFSPPVASHLSRLAQMLSNRTDDPNTGVGCVIAVDDEIVSVGWNGFPSKALYGNHPRGSRHDKGTQEKYPHVIHAEQNALMCRNRRDLSNSIAYVNKIPCDECMPMLYELGVKTVVLPNVEVFYFHKLLEKNEINVYIQGNQNK